MTTSYTISVTPPGSSDAVTLEEMATQLSEQKQEIAVLQAQVNSLLPPYDPYFDNVVLLCHFTGTNGSTTFTDTSNSAHVMTGVNGAAISTTQSAFGSGSASFDGTTYITTPFDDDFNFGSDQFTMEMWVYITGGSGLGMFFVHWWPNPQTIFFGLDGTKLALDISTDGSDYIPFVGRQLTSNVWQHVALDRDSNGMLRMYVNGDVISASEADISIFDDTSTGSSNVVNIGGGTWGGFTGYINEMRITKGIARYAGNAFTPPTAGYPDTGTW